MATYKDFNSDSLNNVGVDKKAIEQKKQAQKCLFTVFRMCLVNGADRIITAPLQLSATILQMTCLSR